jgi:hypothetical protein
MRVYAFPPLRGPGEHDSGIKEADPESGIDFPTPTRLADGLGLESSPVAYSGFTPELVPPVPPTAEFGVWLLGLLEILWSAPRSVNLKRDR